MSSTTTQPHPQQQPHLVNKLQPPPINGMSPNDITPSTAQRENSPTETVSSNVSQQPQSDPNVSGPPTSKKGKGKKPADPLETSKLLAAKISQLESDRAGEKDIETEIANEVRRANREISNLLAHVESPLSRLEALQKRYSDLLTDMRRLDRDHVRTKKRVEQLQKERDQSKTELNKANGVKDKLEKLCRELQKDNKKMKEEFKDLEVTEAKKRTELNEKVDAVLSEVQDIVKGKDSTGNMTEEKQLDLQQIFASKFKSFIEQYDLREIHFNAEMRVKEAEVLMYMARHHQEKQRADQAEARAQALNAQVATFSRTETELRNQLNIYVEKFKQVGDGISHRESYLSVVAMTLDTLRIGNEEDRHRVRSLLMNVAIAQVEDTLNNSNDLFLTFRKEMEDMSKKTKRLEKENMGLSRKHDVTNRNLIEMAEERQRMGKEMEVFKKKNDQLEKLCRAMQAESRAGVTNPVAIGTTSTANPPASAAMAEHDDAGTESEYEYDDEEEDGDDEEEDEDEVGDEGDDEEDGTGEEGEDGGGIGGTNQHKDVRKEPPKFGPVPPPTSSVSSSHKKNGVGKGGK
ncbi:MAG: hypothetical protein M1816_003142 [Peltula sp. TS41687]|nr:MAG: hypothetical protein M1816_003142 [Peltula sp. TS41687]